MDVNADDGLLDRLRPVIDIGDGWGGDAINIETGFMLIVGEFCGGCDAYGLKDMSVASHCGGVGTLMGLLD